MIESRQFISIGAFLGFLAVALGAFGNHALESTMVELDTVETYKTAVQYIFYHAIGLFLVSHVISLVTTPLAIWAGWAMVIGTALFSGSLLLIAVFDVQGLGIITPIGGLFFLAGWAMLGIAAVKGRRREPAVEVAKPE